MRMQIALIILLASCLINIFCFSSPEDPSFLIFSNDGTFYKLDPVDQHVHWHSDLGFKLISFQISEADTHFQTDISTYFIPTIEGHFVYIAKNTEILVHRKEIQPLLKICFGKSNQSKNLVFPSQQQYFLHQKHEYFFIDLHTGKLWNIENFFQEKIVAKQGRHGLIKVSKKFLKQLKPNLDVKWSVISSTIDIISAVQFLSDPKGSIFTDQAQTRHYEFRRTSNSEMQVFNIKNNKIFQMGSTSPIMTVFSCQKNGTLFQKYPIYVSKKPFLAIEDKHQNQISQGKSQIIKAENNVFPHAGEFKNSNRSNKKSGQVHQPSSFDFEYCINTFRAIQQLHSDPHISNNIPFINQKPLIGRNDQNTEQNAQSLPPKEQIQPISYPHLFQQPQRSKQQPLIWVFIIGSLIAFGILFYRFKVGKLLIQLQKLQTQHDKKFQEIQKKLGQFEQMQKMYEVFWDKLLYNKPRRKASDVYIQQMDQNNQCKRTRQNQIETYEHLIFEGRFLNKEALVYAIPMDGIDIIHVQHQLNDLLSCSHKSLVKLYYYTKNSQFLLIFCQKIQPLWQSIDNSSFFTIFQNKDHDKVFKNIENIMAQRLSQSDQKIDKNAELIKQVPKTKNISNQQAQKSLNLLIKQTIECLTYLDSKIQIFSLPLQGIIVNKRTLILSEKDTQKSISASNFQIQLKINTIPSILQVCKLDDDQSEEAKLQDKQNMKTKLRHDLVKIFYFINTKGQKTSVKSIYSMISNEQNSVEENFFVRDFYDFVLNENYNLSIEVETSEKLQSKDEEKKIRIFGINYEFLNNLLCHPFLWDSKRKIHFLSDFSNYIETYLDDYKIKKLQSYAKDYVIIDTPWTKHLDIAFVREVNQFRKYDFNSVRDLIRLIRNKLNHFHEIPKETRNSIGKTPEAFIQYMLKLYPKLLSFAFVYAKKKKWKLHVQIK